MKEPSEIIITIIAIIIGAIILFLILREIVCWYYKINRRIELAEEQVRLLKKIYTKMFPDDTSEAESVGTISINEEEHIKGVESAYHYLDKETRAEVDELIKYYVEEGDLIVLERKTKKVTRFDAKQWDDIAKSGKIDNWVVIKKA